MTSRSRTPKRYVEALKLSGGVVSEAAAMLGVSRRAVYNMARRHPEIREAIEDARETLLDRAESHLSRWVDEGREQAVYFVLKTLGKKRGYYDGKAAPIEPEEFDEPEGEDWIETADAELLREYARKHFAGNPVIHVVYEEAPLPINRAQSEPYT